MKTLITVMFWFVPCFVMPPVAATGTEVGNIEFIDLREARLDDALRLLSEETGINIVATHESMDKPVSLFVQNVTLEDALETLCKCHSLWYKMEEDSEVITVMTIGEYQQTLVVYREEKTEVFTLLHPNANHVGRAIRDLYGKRVLLTVSSERIYDEQFELERRFNRLDLLEERGQFGQRFGQQGGYGGGTYGGRYGGYIGRYGGGYGGGYGGYGGGRYGGGYGGGYGGYGGEGQAQQGPEYDPVDAQIRIQEKEKELTPQDVFAAEQLEYLRGLDMEKMDEQSRSEVASGIAKLVRDITDKEAPIYVTVLSRNNQIVVRTGDEEAVNAIRELITKLDVPTPQVLLDVRVLAVRLSDEFQSVFDLTYNTNSSSYPKTVGIGGGDPTSAGTLVTGDGGFLYQYLDSKLNFQIQMLEDENRVTAMASPLLMVANNEVSKVFVGEEVPIVTNVSTDIVQDATLVGSNTVYYTPETEVRNVGTTLLITPNINSDRSVTLRILQENSNVNEDGAKIPISDGSGGVQDYFIDTVETRSVTGTVVAKDGLTLAIGGLIEETVVDNDSGVPFFKDIPLIGFFFSNIRQQRERKELIVLIRPFVVITPEDAERASRNRLEALSIHPYRFGKEDSLETFEPKEVPGLVKPGPSWARALKIHQLGILDPDWDLGFWPDDEVREVLNRGEEDDESVIYLQEDSRN